MLTSITTSDGFVATGHAVDGAADYALLDEFTVYLERRAFSLNLWLLRRLLAEFFCHCETSALQMAAQGATQIAIGPMGIDDEALDAEAQQMLERRRRTAVDSGSSSRVFTYLVTRLRTVRLSLLMSFFVEYCQGEDDALSQFLEEGEGFVSILPCLLPVPVHSHTSTDGIAFQSDEPLAMPPVPRRPGLVTPTHRLASGKKSRKIQPAAKPLAVAAATQHTDQPTGSALDRSSPAARDVKLHIIAEVAKIEAQRPWRKLYNASSPPLPFDEERFPAQAEQLRSFWAKYGRVVWERSFWAPLSEDIDAELMATRKARQRKASCVFERIIEMCYEQFGPRFFYKLDRERHPGWWYRGLPMELMSIATSFGARRCLKYVQTQQLERFPDCGHELPRRSANAGVILSKHQNKVVSEAMWVQSNKGTFEEMRQGYATYLAKKQRKEAKKGRKKQKIAAKSTVEKHQQTLPVVDKKPSREKLRAAAAAAQVKRESYGGLVHAFQDDDDDDDDDDRPHRYFKGFGDY